MKKSQYEQEVEVWIRQQLERAADCQDYIGACRRTISRSRRLIRLEAEQKRIILSHIADVRRERAAWKKKQRARRKRK